MSDESPETTEEAVEDAAAEEEAVAEEVEEREAVEEDAKPLPKRRKRRTAQNPPLTAEELKGKIVGWGERVGVALVGLFTRLVNETTEKVENVAERVARDLEDEDDDEDETVEEKA